MRAVDIAPSGGRLANIADAAASTDNVSLPPEFQMDRRVSNEALPANTVDRRMPERRPGDEALLKPSDKLIPDNRQDELLNKLGGKQEFNPNDLKGLQKAGDTSLANDKPTAEFLGLQQNGEPLFNVVGGPSDKSTVGLDKLKELGIEAPEVPTDAKPMKGSELRALAQKNRSAAMDARNAKSGSFKGFVDDTVSDANPEVPERESLLTGERGSVEFNNPNPQAKPRFRLDSETGAGIPIDEKGNQIGPAQFSGKELRPDLAEFSKYTSGHANDTGFDNNGLLTKLANFSSKITRSVLGLHIPKTALSFHGFNEAIRNTLFGPDLNPISAAKRFGNAVNYLARPSVANDYLKANAGDLAKAINDGGLRVQTTDIANKSLFGGGNNILSRGFNALTDPKPLFQQVIPALKLKSYNGLLKQYQEAGMSYSKSARLAGEATNNIFGGLNLQALQRNSNTQKLFRSVALAPDWLETNMRIGKGMANAIRHPLTPQYKVYATGMANFLGSYIGMNVLNAINNDGKFMFQNDPGHELDVAFGKDSKGRNRYFSPYGTAMDMFRIPLTIAHAAVNGDLGESFKLMRSRASEPLQFMTDLMSNTDYAGNTLFGKTKFGKPQSPAVQAGNVGGDLADHVLPIGVQSGIGVARNKVSPEEFAAQALQLPIKYGFPKNKPNPLMNIK
jgi:hypothetical protein